MDFMLRVFCCCYFYFFLTTTKMFLSEHLKVYLHQKFIANQRTKKGTLITTEDSPHFQLKEASSPGLLTKQDQAALLGGTFGPMGPGFPGLQNTAIAMQLEGE